MVSNPPLFAGTPQAAVGRPVAKSKIHANAKLTAVLRTLFVEQVESMVDINYPGWGDGGSSPHSYPKWWRDAQADPRHYGHLHPGRDRQNFSKAVKANHHTYTIAFSLIQKTSATLSTSRIPAPNRLLKYCPNLLISECKKKFRKIKFSERGVAPLQGIFQQHC